MTAATKTKPNKKNLVKFTITFDADQLLKDIMESFPEYAQYNFCITHYDYDKVEYKFTDDEDGKKYVCNLPKLRKGLQLMLREFEQGKLPGLSVNLDNFRDAGQWDAYDTHALIQFAMLGECIYG